MVEILKLDNVVNDILRAQQICALEIHQEILIGLSISLDRAYKAPDLNLSLEGVDAQRCAWNKAVLDNFSEASAKNPALGRFQGNQLHWYLYFSGYCYEWDYVLPLTQNINWIDRSMPTPWSELAVERFPKLVKVINELPFMARGMVSILGVAAGKSIPLHTDSKPGYSSRFLMLNFSAEEMRRSTKIILEDNSVEEIASDCYWFDDSLLHGSNPKAHFTYIIKVDGAFGIDKMIQISGG